MKTLNVAARGQLLSDLSPDLVGLAHWKVKRDFRRVENGEAMAEGYVLFH